MGRFWFVMALVMGMVVGAHVGFEAWHIWAPNAILLGISAGIAMDYFEE